MFTSDTNQDELARAIDDLRGLITQQEYEFQRLFADLQLCAMTMDQLVATGKATDTAVDAVRDSGRNLRYELRNAREVVAEAVRSLRDAQTALGHLEPND